MADVKELEKSLQSLKTSRDIANNGANINIQAEIQQATQVNAVIESVLDSIGNAKSNISSVLQATNNANLLLDKWIKILSQTEHTQRLLSDHNWQGYSKDKQIVAEREAQRARIVQQRQAQAEKEKQLQEVRLKRERELAEKQRAQRETLQRRIYGNRPPVKRANTTAATSVVAGSTNPTRSARLGSRSIAPASGSRMGPSRPSSAVSSSAVPRSTQRNTRPNNR